MLFWLARTYARGTKPTDGLSFDDTALPKTALVSPRTLEQLQLLEKQVRERDEKLAELLTGKTTVDQELQRLRAEIAEAKRQNAARPDTHNYSEAETRDYFIDLLLKEAGWPLDKPQDRELEVRGMPNKEGKGFVDYVLWGDDGRPLGLVEAKRTKRDARVGQQQAKLYADCLERQFNQRPIIFYSYGYDHWMWDEASYPPRPVQGFYKKSELELLIQRRETRKRLADAPINEAIVERFYQTRAIRRIGEAFEHDHDRKALVVMATGAGKTRTVIALSDLLMRCNWAKRVLFLADRVALVTQEPCARAVHRRPIRQELQALQGRVRAGDRLPSRVRAKPDRRLLQSGQDAAHRHLGGHAGHRHRRSRSGEPRLLQVGAFEDQVLADAWARHSIVPRSVWAWERQGVLLCLRLLPESGVLQPEP